MIKISNVSKTYKNGSISTIALSDISIELPNKGFVGLLGKNGCGKSTLLNLISSVDVDFDGEILIDNLNVKKNTQIIRKKVISYVFQDDFFIDNLSVEENLKLINENCIYSDFNNLLPMDKLSLFPRELSGGQKQKVSIWRSLEKPFDVLLVDEPTSNLDEDTTNTVFKILSEISKEKLVILVSHDLKMMNSYCNMMVELKDGKIAQVYTNNTINDVNYTEYGVVFSGNVNLMAISTNIMDAILEKEGKFIIEKTISEKKNTFDYSIKEREKNVKIVASRQHKKKILHSYFRSNIGNMIFGIFLFSILLFIFQTLLDFACFDSNEFMYQTINKNEDSYVICKQYDLLYDSFPFNKKQIMDISSKYHVNIDFNSTIETNATYQFAEYKEYRPYLTYAVHTNFLNYDFIYGQKPQNSLCIAITDYIADALIQGNINYYNYSDIIENGIYIDDVRIMVSGIIKSNYKKYVSNRMTAKDKMDFDYYQQHFYSAIFYLDDIIGDEYSAYFISSCNQFVKLIFTSDIISTNNCKISSKLADKLGINAYKETSLKIMNSYINVNGICDEDDDYVVYLSNELKEQEHFSFDFFMTRVTDRTFFDYLFSNNVRMYCYSYDYAVKTIDIISVINKIFVVFLIFMILLILICIIRYIHTSNRVHNNLYGLCMVTGDNNIDYLWIELKNIIMTSILVLFFNLLLYYFGYYILNVVLSNIFSIKITIFISSLYSIFIGFASFLVIFIFSILIMNYLRKKKSMLVFLKK